MVHTILVIMIIEKSFKFISPAPCLQNIKITGPATVYEGDNIILTCQTTFIMVVLEIILSWEPGSIGRNMTIENEQYLPNSNDPRMVTSSNITVKVKDKINMGPAGVPVLSHVGEEQGRGLTTSVQTTLTSKGISIWAHEQVIFLGSIVSERRDDPVNTLPARIKTKAR